MEVPGYCNFQRTLQLIECLLIETDLSLQMTVLLTENDNITKAGSILKINPGRLTQEMTS